MLASTFAILLLAGATSTPETQTLHLSGSGYNDTVDWEFICTEGRNCGRWTTIPVPSQWELQGFGSYNYGHDDDKADEQGRYRHRFRVPADWRGKTVDLVFEGVMTDAEVRVNGESTGPRHQGAFYRFRYDVTELLDVEGENVLEVDVSKQSSNKSVNRAERDADYWVFGGIFRPVYLEAAPPESIDHVAVDARHDGELRLRVRLRGLAAPGRLEARVLNLGGEDVGRPFTVDVDGTAAQLETAVTGVRTWSAESPHLYQLRLDLTRGGELLHRHTERFGFRTVEVRPLGLHVNGRRVRLKGVNRHAFFPASGRTMNPGLDRFDAELIKTMNMNAVRMSHYPPDESFLEACDEIGLYVLDELAGWHDAYGTEVGRRLVREMVERDVNHPSILFWDNGNEGGWNKKLDRVFGEHDIQNRPVLRPQAIAAGIDTDHYPTWDELLDSLSGSGELVMPTELLHGLYDGGSGASLGDYWHAIRRSPRGAGAFLWVFTDEAVARTDRGGVLDTDGNHAPDGILGPYRELSGTYFAVREVFSPVVLVDEALADGVLEFENRYDFTELSDVRFRWAWVVLPGPDVADAELVELESGELAGPAAPPGQSRRLRVPRPPSDDAEALQLTAIDPHDRDIHTWVLPRRNRRLLAVSMVPEGSGEVTAKEERGRLELRAGDVEAVFDPETGQLLTLGREAEKIQIHGPLPAPRTEVPLSALRHWPEPSGHVVEARYAKGFDFVRWKLYPSGWLRLAYQYVVRGRLPYFGIALPLPAEEIESFEWLGHGPARIWKNRREGGVLGVWLKEAAASSPVTSAHESKLAGYYGGVYWARVRTSESLLTLVLADDLDLGISTPAFPDDARDAVAAVPGDSVTILNGISPIGTKFHPADELGPQGRPHEVDGLYRGTVWLYAGELSYHRTGLKP